MPNQRPIIDPNLEVRHHLGLREIHDDRSPQFWQSVENPDLLICWSFARGQWEYTRHPPNQILPNGMRRWFIFSHNTAIGGDWVPYFPTLRR